MSLKDAKRIYDIAIRLQLYIEGVKANQGLEFGQVMAEVNFEFKKLLNSVKYQTLDGLTKAELNRLVLSLRQSQSKIYSAYLEKILKQLEDFTQAALSVTRIAYASGFIGLGDESEPEEILSDSKASNLIVEEDESSALIA